jgi:hypothetical protein
MTDLAIRVDGLGKKYHIGGRQEGYRTLRDTLRDAFAFPFRRVGTGLRLFPVSFDYVTFYLSLLTFHKKKTFHL